MSKEDEGVIIKSEYVFCENEVYLELEIQIFDGWLTTMTFEPSLIPKILNDFLPSERYKKKVSQLLHKKVRLYYLRDNLTAAPDAISALCGTWIYKRGVSDD